MSNIITAGNATNNGTSISSDTSGVLELKTGSTPTTAITVDASQNVGIGTSTFNGVKTVVQGAQTGGAPQTSGTTQTYGLLRLKGTTFTSALDFGTNGGNYNWIQATDSANLATNYDLAIQPNGGNLLVGTTSATGKFTVSGNAGASRVAAVMSNTASDAGSGALLVSKFDNVNTTSQVFVAFAVNNNSVGSGQINANGSGSAAFGSYSDSRLKENITELPSQLDNIMALRPVEFDYIESEGGGHQIGFIAQEVQEVYPDLVGERSDGMLTLTDLNKNDARLIKAIQELKAELDATKAEVAALKGA